MTSISAVELGYRIAVSADSGGWLPLIAPDELDVVAAAELRSAVREALQTEALVIAASAGPGALATQLTRAGDGVAIVVGLNGWTHDDWRRLDGARSRLERRATTILILSKETLARLEVGAPNLASWLGADLWEWRRSADSLSPHEIEERLQSLRLRYGKTDAEIIALAESGDLALGPQEVEWLVLLGRGDLVP